MANGYNGDGSLDSSYGIFAEARTVSVTGGKLFCTAGNSTFLSFGVKAETIAVSGDGILECTSGDCPFEVYLDGSVGIMCTSITVSDSGSVTGRSTDGTNGRGVSPKNNWFAATVSSGSFTAQGSLGAVLYAAHNDKGVRVYRNTSVTLGSGVTATTSTSYAGPGDVDYTSGSTLDQTVHYFHAEGSASDPDPDPAPRRSGGSGSAKTTAYSGDDNVKVIVEDGDVAIKKLAAGDESYDLLLKAASGTPLMAYEIDATDGEDGARVMFYVGRENAGKEYTVLHRLADGSVEEFHVTCAANGWITVLVNSLSPFMVFEGSVKAAGTAVRVTSDENPDTGANDAVALAAALGTLALLGCCAVGKRRR